MPTYTFRNKDTDEVFDKLFKWSDRQKFLKENPNIEPVITSAALGDSVDWAFVVQMMVLRKYYLKLVRQILKVI